MVISVVARHFELPSYIIILLVAALALVAYRTKDLFKKFPLAAMDGTRKGDVIAETTKSYFIVTKVLDYKTITFRTYAKCTNTELLKIQKEIRMGSTNKSWMEDFVAEYKILHNKWQPKKKEGR